MTFTHLYQNIQKTHRIHVASVYFPPVVSQTWLYNLFQPFNPTQTVDKTQLQANTNYMSIYLLTSNIKVHQIQPTTTFGNIYTDSRDITTTSYTHLYNVYSYTQREDNEKRTHCSNIITAITFD